MRDKVQAHRANVHRFPKNVLIRNVFAVDVNLPSPGGIIVQHSAQERNGSPHFLFLGKFLRVLSFALRISKIIRGQAAPSAFKKMLINALYVYVVGKPASDRFHPNDLQNEFYQ